MRMRGRRRRRAEDAGVTEAGVNEVAVLKLEAVEGVAAEFDIEPFAGVVDDDLDAGPGAGGKDVMDDDLDAVGDGVAAEVNILGADVSDVAGGLAGLVGGVVEGGEFEAVDVAEELEDEGGGGFVVNLLGRADLLDAGVVHDNDLVGELEGLLLVVGDKDGGEVDVFLEIEEPAAEFLADFGVEGAKRFVEEEDFGLGGEGAGEGDALALAAGELVGEAVAEAGEADHFEEFVDAVGDFLFGRAVFAADFEAEGDVFKDVEVTEEGVVLEDEADAALAGRGVGDVLAVEVDAAAAVGIGVFEAGHDAQEGGFAATGGAEEGDEGAGGDLEFEVFEGDVAAEGLADVDGVDAHEEFKIEN
jgi:hypothetical protein